MASFLDDDWNGWFAWNWSHDEKAGRVLEHKGRSSGTCRLQRVELTARKDPRDSSVVVDRCVFRWFGLYL